MMYNPSTQRTTQSKENKLEKKKFTHILFKPSSTDVNTGICILLANFNVNNNEMIDYPYIDGETGTYPEIATFNNKLICYNEDFVYYDDFGNPKKSETTDGNKLSKKKKKKKEQIRFEKQINFIPSNKDEDDLLLSSICLNKHFNTEKKFDNLTVFFRFSKKEIKDCNYQEDPNAPYPIDYEYELTHSPNEVSAFDMQNNKKIRINNAFIVSILTKTKTEYLSKCKYKKEGTEGKCVPNII